MFDVGFQELFIVAVLAIVVVGPKDLPKVIRSVMGMINKVRDMGSEFQAGMKKMADEVELEAVTRKLNEAGNIKLEDDKSSSDSKPDFSDYDEYDYDQYDYDGYNYEPPAPSKDEKSEEVSEEAPAETEEAAHVEEAPVPEATEVAEEAAPAEEDEDKSKVNE